MRNFAPMTKNIGIFTLLLLTLFSCAQQTTDGGGVLNAQAFEEKLNSTADKQVVDVRTPEEFATGNIPGAQLMNIFDDDFKSQLGKLDKDKPVFVYCKGGGRSAEAAGIMKEMGFKTVYDLKGGMMSWTNAGKAVEVKSANNNNEKPAAAVKLPNHLYSKAELDSAANASIPVLVDFYATWCAPCKRMAPVLEKLMEEFKGKVAIVKVDADAAKELCKELKIDGLPVVRTYKKGKEVGNKSGFQSEEELRALIAELLK